MDHRDWIDSTRAFFARLEGVEGVSRRWCRFDEPATEAEVREAERGLGARLPDALRRFFLDGARRNELHYRWEAPPQHAEAARRLLGTTIVYGGLEVFCDLEGVVSLTEGVSQLREYERQQPAEWRNPYLSEAMVAIGSVNGDSLALDLAKDAEDPPVIYLAHDGDSHEMGPSFDAFLDRWAGLCYLNPMMSVPYAWLVDTEGGGGPTANATALPALRGYLGVAGAGRTVP